MLLVLTNYEIGRRIVEHEQGGESRADYGEAILANLSRELTAEFGRGFSAVNLSLMRRFFLVYRSRRPIFQTPSNESEAEPDGGPSRRTGGEPLARSSAAETPAFTLSWSHYAFLIGIKDENTRSFYEIEATRGQWSLKELRRQFDCALYERLALSRDAAGVRALADQGHVVTRPEEALKDPYVLEFLGLDERTSYSCQATAQTDPPAP